MKVPAAGRAEVEQVAALREPAVAGDERHDLGFLSHRHGVEVGAVEGLAGEQASFGAVALDAAAGALGGLVFREHGEGAQHGGGPFAGSLEPSTYTSSAAPSSSTLMIGRMRHCPPLVRGQWRMPGAP